MKTVASILCVLTLTCGLGLAGCGDPNRNAGDRCTTADRCEPPLICSNRDAPEEQGICVWPEALPDAAMSQDASS